MEKIKLNLHLVNLRKFASVKLLIPVIAFVAAIAIVAGVYFFSQYQKAQKQLANPPQLGVAESQQIVNKISKLIELPTDEQPSIATVSDINKLKDQPFFKNAKNGDSVLIYAQNKKAIIYRPSTNKIIEVAPVNLGGNETAQNPTVAASNSGQVAGSAVSPTPKTVRVAIYNGTKTAGLAKSVGESLKSKFNNVEIVSTANASEDYAKNLVVDLSGNNKSLVQNIASELKGEAGNLPSSETKPNADILVILGATQ